MGVGIDINNPSGWHDAENITLVIAEGAAVENGQRLLDTYASVKLQGGWTSTNKMNITLQPGVYDLGSVPLIMDVPYVNLCSLVVDKTDSSVNIISSYVDTSLTEVTSILIKGNNIGLLGIRTQQAVLIGDSPTSLTDISFKYCVGGDSFGVSLLDGHNTFHSCTGGSNFGYCLNDNYNKAYSCKVGDNFLATVNDNYSEANYCISGDNSFSSGGINYGQYKYCQITTPFPTVTTPGLIEFCIDSNGANPSPPKLLSYEMVLNQSQINGLSVTYQFFTSLQLGVGAGQMAKIHANLTEFRVFPATSGFTVTGSTIISIFSNPWSNTVTSFNCAFIGTDNRLYVGDAPSTEVRLSTNYGVRNTGSLVANDVDCQIKIKIFYEVIDTNL